MKLIGIMSLESDLQEVKEIFDNHDVQIFSETQIKGHTRRTIERFGWAPETRIPFYSVLCFAVMDKMRADDIMREIAARAEMEKSEHPIRAFQVDVEQMI